MTVAPATIEHIPSASYENYARFKKAEQLVAVLLEARIPAEAVPDLTPAQRHQLEAQANIKIASSITWGLAALILSQRSTHAHQAKPKRKPVPTVADIHKAVAATAAAQTRQPKLF